MKFDSEAAMCAAFIKALPDSWTAYPETAGWDILLVRKEDGAQIGIEAKKRLNFDVVNQALKGWRGQKDGPDYRAILVPQGYLGDELTRYLGITVMHVVEREKWDASAGRFGDYVKRAEISPELPKVSDGKHHWNLRDWHDWAPDTRCALPDYIPDVAAGASAPLQLTAWKINALRICHLIERFGSVTRADFRALDIDSGRWMARGGWLVMVDDQRGHWTFSKWCPNFRGQHATVYAQIAADFETWCPAHRKAAA